MADDYDDLAIAVLRGGVFGDGQLDEPGLREVYSVILDSYDQMVAELILEVVVDAGSVGAAARVLGLDEFEVEARIQWARTEPRRVRESYVVGLDSWDRMSARLLLAVVEDAGSARKAAKVLGVPRSTLSARVQRARQLIGVAGVLVGRGRAED